MMMCVTVKIDGKCSDWLRKEGKVTQGLYSYKNNSVLMF